MEDKRDKGWLSILTIESSALSPLDTRELVPNLVDLISEEWWNNATLFNGLTVTVLDSDGAGTPALYVLRDKDMYNELDSWHKVTSGEGGSSDTPPSITIDASGVITSADLVLKSEANRPFGYARLNKAAKVLPDQLPSYMSKVEEYETWFDFPKVGNLDVIYVNLFADDEHEARTSFRWTGTGYTLVSNSLIIGEIFGTAYDGGRGYLLEQQIRDLQDIIGIKEDIIDSTKTIYEKLNELDWYNGGSNI